jgi:hypothetical protein
MKNLYDVFSAIRDDEDDHVRTMEACLDPTVAKLSPSLECKALTAVAAAIAIGIFVGSGNVISSDIVDTSVDVSATADNAAVATGLVERAIAGVVGALNVEEGLELEEGAFILGIANELMKILSHLL